mmetsp:Transcript_23017/g.69228  ORF Transcript_23017/g.69228 Transcript_23017/m.69228 type:complete len:248 (+) Transcript_23017:416-1159(+)
MRRLLSTVKCFGPLRSLLGGHGGSLCRRNVLLLGQGQDRDLLLKVNMVAGKAFGMSRLNRLDQRNVGGCRDGLGVPAVLNTDRCLQVGYRLCSAPFLGDQSLRVHRQQLGPICGSLELGRWRRRRRLAQLDRALALVGDKRLLTDSDGRHSRLHALAGCAGNLGRVLRKPRFERLPAASDPHHDVCVKDANEELLGRACNHVRSLANPNELDVSPGRFDHLLDLHVQLALVHSGFRLHPPRLDICKR